MAQASARIYATPSKVDALTNQEIGAELQEALARSREGEFKYNYLYGFRKLGDPLIDYRRESKQWTYPQDIEFIVLCHAEEGHNVAYVDIKIDQSSTQHDANIIGGGIGQNHIRILLKAQNTYWFKYEVRIFGRNNLQEIKE
ncbi:uncharacterized protein LOC135964106 [Calliphora vicina]|uniref:uncharacterized protein LOC135964106 n=1 Tax=Calliphora vicina TaxID=7373 RepID=UPI00325AD734